MGSLSPVYPPGYTSLIILAEEQARCMTGQPVCTVTRRGAPEGELPWVLNIPDIPEREGVTEERGLCE